MFKYTLLCLFGFLISLITAGDGLTPIPGTVTTAIVYRGDDRTPEEMEVIGSIEITDLIFNVNEEFRTIGKTSPHPEELEFAVKRLIPWTAVTQVLEKIGGRWIELEKNARGQWKPKAAGTGGAGGTTTGGTGGIGGPGSSSTGTSGGPGKATTGTGKTATGTDNSNTGTGKTTTGTGKTTIGTDKTTGTGTASSSTGSSSKGKGRPKTRRHRARRNGYWDGWGEYLLYSYELFYKLNYNVI
ncbi:hypothetical protein VHEMI09081 [[Torrubiella] hemipterigena]|uniref:Uncharacterized protein n=1 Tax=[Torrubiella] hemipterigena TaxID=1531966 RepID=A0A0A1TFD9_9HYPO|nr:hypothetical protein VHEMI09081 [[Torrubiella] hemipterigena]